jgi:hypothetical protein
MAGLIWLWQRGQDAGGGTFADYATAAGIRPKRGEHGTMGMCILAVGGGVLI